MNVSLTFTIRLFKNGKEFRCMTNVVDDFRPRPAVGDVIDEKWKVLGRIGNSVGEIVLDVKEVAS